jgi:hypothetical protein
MPLTRLNDKAFAASLAGVAFDMTDGSRTVNCMVTYPALQDKFPGLAIARCVEADRWVRRSQHGRDGGSAVKKQSSLTEKIILPWDRKRTRRKRRDARRLDRAVEAQVERPELLVMRPVARLVDIEQGHHEAGLLRLAPDARGRLNVLGGGLRLALNDHQPEATDVETDGDHVGGHGHVDRILPRGR